MTHVEPGELDRLAADATAPRAIERLGGWRLQVDADLPFRRSNTVVPLADAGRRYEVEARIDAVEAFARAHGAPPRFQIGPAADPDDLDDRLGGRGYEVEAPVDVLVADLDEVIAVTGGAREPWAVHVADRLRPAQRAVLATDGRHRDRLVGYERLLSYRAPAGSVATAERDGEPAAIGFGVVAEGWLGLFGMSTRAGWRRQGAARLVLGALARAARDEGATRLYLQVEIGNDPARRLYESVGCRFNHRYHYRVLVSGAPSRDAASP